MNDSNEEINSPLSNESTHAESSATHVKQDHGLNLSVKKKDELIIDDRLKIMIINLYKSKILKKTHNKTFDDIMLCVSKESGIGLRLIKKVVNEYRESKKTGYVKPPPDRKNNYEQIDDSNKIAIRKKIHAYWLRREIPTIQKVLWAIKKDSDLSNITRSLFYQILKELNFKYSKSKQNRALIEREDLVLWRQKYISDIRRYRSEGRKIYYLDEMLIRANSCFRDLYVAGFYTRPENETDKGKCLIALHIGSAEGFVDGGFMCFEPKKNATNCHDEINSDLFYDWFCGVLPRLDDNCIIVMDNVTNHSLKKDLIPTLDWRKENIIKWLVSKNCVADQSMIKYRLMEMVNQIKPLYDKNLIDEEALKTNKVVLRLPPLHDELNPIQLALLMVKNHVKTHNTTWKLSDVQKLIKEGIQLLTPDTWSNFVSYAIEEENKLYDIDFAVDEVLDSAIDQFQTTEDISSEFSD